MFSLKIFVICLIIFSQCLAYADMGKLHKQWYQDLSPEEKTIFSEKEVLSGGDNIHFIKAGTFKGVQCPLNAYLEVRPDGFSLRADGRTQSDLCKLGDYYFSYGNFDKNMIAKDLSILDPSVSASKIYIVPGKERLVEPYLKDFPSLSKSYYVHLAADERDFSSFTLFTKKPLTLFGIEFPPMSTFQFTIEKKKIESLYISLPTPSKLQNAKCSIINYFQKGMVECTLAEDFATSVGIIPKDSQIRFKTTPNRIVTDGKNFYISTLSQRAKLSGDEFLPGEDIKIGTKGATRKFDAKEMGEVTGERDGD